MASTGESAPWPSQPPQEMVLVGRVLAGEKELFYDLIRPYEKAVYYTAFAILRNPADAEEVAQETFLKAFRGLDTFRGEARFSTWLQRIAGNEAHMKLRRESHVQYRALELERGDESGEYYPILLADWREIPSEVLERKEIRNEIEKALGQLPDRYREVLVLRDIQQLNIAETAALLQLTTGAVKLRLLRARLRMRDLLAPWLRTSKGRRFHFLKGKNPWS